VGMEIRYQEQRVRQSNEVCERAGSGFRSVL
jgi:hypothetical protein